MSSGWGRWAGRGRAAEEHQSELALHPGWPVLNTAMEEAHTHLPHSDLFAVVDGGGGGGGRVIIVFCLLFLLIIYCRFWFYSLNCHGFVAIGLLWLDCMSDCHLLSC